MGHGQSVSGSLTNRGPDLVLSLVSTPQGDVGATGPVGAPGPKGEKGDMVSGGLFTTAREGSPLHGHGGPPDCCGLTPHHPTPNPRNPVLQMGAASPSSNGTDSE